MPFPRISGVFNNCLPHTLIPELHRKVERLKKPDVRNINRFQPAYDLLKESFVKFYSIDADTFTWENFIDLLNTYNEFDLQILLGPVLRQFMAETMRSKPDLVCLYKAADSQYVEDETNDAFITYKTTIQENGRYASISPDEAFSFLFAPLGFKLTYHQADQVRTLPEDESLPITAVTIEIFHQGGIDGAQAGGHWERTNDEKERTEVELEAHTHFHRLATLLRNDDSQLTTYYVHLLQEHVLCTLNELRQPSGNEDVFHDFELTLAQIEKFLYNRLHVEKELALQLVGQLTQAAEEVIATLPNIEGTEYNELIGAHFPASPTYKQPLKTIYTAQQYKIALTLLTPPVAKLPANSCAKGEAWFLRADEISVLGHVAESYIEYILFEEGLSQSLYDACAHKEIADELPEEFFRLLLADPHFSNRASRLLIEKAQELGLIDVSDVDLDNSGETSVVTTSETKTPLIRQKSVAKDLLSKTDAVDESIGPTHPLLRTKGKTPAQRRSSSQKLDVEGSQEPVVEVLDKSTDETESHDVSTLQSKNPPTPLKGMANPLQERKTLQKYVGRALIFPNSPYHETGNIRMDHYDNDGRLRPKGVALLGSTSNSRSGRQMMTWQDDEVEHGIYSLPEGSTPIVKASRTPAPIITVNTTQTQLPITADFWLRAAQFFLCMGGTLAVVAILTAPPVAASLGITQILGVAVADVAATATFGAVASVLTSLCMFAMRQPADPVQERQYDLRPTR